jgi:rare lipoprotein A
VRIARKSLPQLCIWGVMKHAYPCGSQQQDHSKPFILSSLTGLGLTVGLVLALSLSGCSSKRSAFSGKGSPVYKGSGPIPKGGGRYKIGSPYQIAGRWYTPREDGAYDRVGIASWYGPKFHRRKTANGEWFDMNRMTAAHPTLPLPVFARVTNLENGRSVLVRINDRGPYAHDRVIDMSRKAARKLGMIRKGTARVRVQYLGRAPLSAHAANYYAPNQRPVMTAKADRRTAPPRRIARAAVTRGGPINLTSQLAADPATGSVIRSATWVQAASYANRDNAMRAKSGLSGIGPVELRRIEIGDRAFYRVRVGPLRDQRAARAKLAQVVSAGHGDARIVID